MAKKQAAAQKQSGGAAVQSKAPTTTQSKADDPKVLVSLMQHITVLHLSCLCHSAVRDADTLALSNVNLY